jgi:CBS-domain-containing membrane protein
MDCRAFMSPIATPLYTDQPASIVIDFMREHHMEWLPIVDREDRFAGLISTEKLMRALLPKSIGMMRGFKLASYLRESYRDLQSRMDTIRALKAIDLIDPYAKTVLPDAALADALMVISDRQYVVPVVDKQTRLLGVISYFSIMHALEEAAQDQSS